MDTAPLQFGQQLFQFAKPNQRISSHQGDVQRAVLFNQAKSALHQCAAFVVRKLAESNTGYPQMVVFIGVTPGAAKRDTRE